MEFYGNVPHIINMIKVRNLGGWVTWIGEKEHNKRKYIEEILKKEVGEDKERHGWNMWMNI